MNHIVSPAAPSATTAGPATRWRNSSKRWPKPALSLMRAMLPRKAGPPDREGKTYCRALSEEEFAALVAAGIAEPLYDGEVSLEEDEAERDAFFAFLTSGPEFHRQSGLDPGSTCSGGVEDKSDAGSSPA